MSSSKLKFLKPDDVENFKEDRSDADGTNNTSFIFNQYTNLSIERQRQHLPVYTVRTHFLCLAENYQTVLITGETGSGKSTQLPQYLFEANWGVDGIIAVVQPRRVACTSLAARVSEEKSCSLSQVVGYSIRFDDCTTLGVTKIKFMTEGILIREMMADPLLRQYCAVILDEVHERTLYTDIILGLIKKILRRRKDLHLFICSATYDVHSFFNFFNFNKTKDSSKDTVSILAIQGRSYPINIHYSKDPVPHYVRASVDTAMKIHKNEPTGSILIFLTGVEEIEECVQLLINESKTLKKDQGTLVVLPMHGSLPNQDQLKVFLLSPPNIRKIVVATNIAETSITIPDVVYVIDCGFVKLRCYNADSRFDFLVVVPTSRASAIQRAGRAGRIRSGKVYRLYTESEYEKLSEITPPEMVRTNLSSAVLNLMALGVDNMLRFDFPSPPPAVHLVASLEELFALGALDIEGQLTIPLGQHMAELPLSPQLSKMLLVSGEYGCSQEILSIIAMLQVQNIFILPHGKKLQAKQMHRKFQVSEGDLLTLLNVYTAFDSQGGSKRWCSTYFLNHRALKRAQEIRNSMRKIYTNFELPLNTSEGGTDAVCKCITSGLFANAAYLHHSGVYQTVRGNQPIHIHPSSVLYDQTQPQWVLFGEVLHTSQVYMRDMTVIDQKWLLDLAPHFYEKTQLNL